MGQKQDIIMHPYYLNENTLFISNFALTQSNAFTIPKNNGNIEIINNTLYFLNPEGLLFKYSMGKSELLDDLDFIKNIQNLDNSLNSLLIVYADESNIKLFFLADRSVFNIPLASLFAVSQNSTDIIYVHKREIKFYRNFKQTFMNKDIKFLWPFNCIVDICINKYYLLIVHNISQKVMKSSIMQIKNKAADSKTLKDEDIILYHFKKPIENINLFKKIIIVKFKDKTLNLFKKGLKIDIQNILIKFLKAKNPQSEKVSNDFLLLLQFLKIENEYKEHERKEEYFIDYFLSDKLYLTTNKGRYFSLENESTLNFLDFNLKKGLIRKIVNYEFNIEKDRLFINDFLFPVPFFISSEFVVFNVKDKFMSIHFWHNSFCIKSFERFKTDNKLLPQVVLMKMSLFKNNNIEQNLTCIKMPILDFSIIRQTTYILTETYLYVFKGTELKGFFELNIKDSQYLISNDCLYLYFRKKKKIIRISENKFEDIPLNFELTNIVYKNVHPEFNFYNKPVYLENKMDNVFQQLNIDLFDRGESLIEAEKETNRLRKLAEKYKEKASNVLKKFQ